MTKKITVVFEFEKVQDKYDEDYTYLDFTRMYRDEENTTASAEMIDGLTEEWGQSDFYHVGITTNLLHALDGGEVLQTQIKHY